jgi:hypothetical protein
MSPYKGSNSGGCHIEDNNSLGMKSIAQSVVDIDLASSPWTLKEKDTGQTECPL